MTNLQTQLQAQFPTLPWQFDKIVAPMTYFKIGGPAEIFWSAGSRSELESVLSFCHQQHIRVTVLGGASNVLIADEGISGLVIQLQLDQVAIQETDASGLVHVMAEAGSKTSLLVGKTVQHGLTGLEFFLGVPGTLGGAIYNNAHYLSHLLGEHVVSIEVMTPSGELTHITQKAAEFGYDSSRFQKTHEVIVSVEFALSKGTLSQSHALIKEATEYRAKTQPLGEPSSGCIFQNAPNTPELQALFPQFAGQAFVPGGFLIDQAGLKGTSRGKIEVSHKHAAFFVNKGHGSSKDVLDLIQQVKDQVKEKWNVELREEIFFIH